MWNVTDATQLEPFDEDSYYQDPLGFFARLRESRPVVATGISQKAAHCILDCRLRPLRKGPAVAADSL